MSKDKVRFESPIGRLLTQAMREEAIIDEKNGKIERSMKLRAAADHMDEMSDILKKTSKPKSE